MNQEIVEKFKSYFTQMNLDDDTALIDIYADNIQFTDPIHQITGLQNLKSYFGQLNKNLLEGTFTFTDESIVNNKAFLSWEMCLKLKRPKKIVRAAGISILTIENKVVSQRDYFDAGELFYEHIPLFGWIIRFIKKKIAG